MSIHQSFVRGILKEASALGFSCEKITDMLKEAARGDFAIPALRKILEAKYKAAPLYWPARLEDMQPYWKNRLFHPPKGTFVPSLKFSGKNPLDHVRTPLWKSNDGWKPRMGGYWEPQPGTLEAEEWRIKTKMPTGEHVNNRRWAAEIIRQARAESRQKQ